MGRGKIIGLCLFFLFVGFTVIQVIRGHYSPEAIKIEIELNAELKNIRPLPDAFSIEESSTRRGRDALVQCYYFTIKSYNDIRKYYDDEIAKHDWQFVSEESIKDWGKDLGGKSVLYRKGDYYLNLFYAGEKSQASWTYSISLSWNK